jgi:hypothetical protein
VTAEHDRRTDRRANGQLHIEKRRIGWQRDFSTIARILFNNPLRPRAVTSKHAHTQEDTWHRTRGTGQTKATQEAGGRRQEAAAWRLTFPQQVVEGLVARRALATVPVRVGHVQAARPVQRRDAEVDDKQSVTGGVPVGGSQQEVLRLDVVVQEAMCVQVFQSLQGLHGEEEQVLVFGFRREGGGGVVCDDGPHLSAQLLHDQRLVPAVQGVGELLVAEHARDAHWHQ